MRRSVFSKGISTIILLFSFTLTLAQTELDERAMVSFDRGLGFHAPDSSFGLNLRFRIQNRLGFAGMEDSDPLIDEVDARIRRLRLRIDGYTRNDRITYYLQLSFSRGDQDWDNSGVPNIIRDAMVYYTVSNNFYMGFGQGKLPGNRQRINSSGQLQFADRSAVNAMFNIDRDFGVMGYYSNNLSGFHYNIKTAISSGEGRNALPSDNGLAYTARVELLPFGLFTGDGDFSEGDLEREPLPKLSVGSGYSFNHKASRSQGQRGSQLYQDKDVGSLFFDAVLKYRGWAIYAEYMDRRTGTPLTVSPDAEISHVQTGYGINTQLSYLFTNNYEIAGRYTVIRPEQIFYASGGNPQGGWFISTPPAEEYTVGLTRYIARHKIKAQGNIGIRNTGLQQVSVTGHESGWFVQFQVELGI